MIIGYTSGVFDLFHIGHVKLLEKASTKCDILIVGVCSDELVYRLKKKKPIYNEKDRLAIINSCKYVSKTILKVFDDDIYLAHLEKANYLFKGSDWKGTEKWNNYIKRAEEFGLTIWFLPHTPNISTTIIKERLEC